MKATNVQEDVTAGTAQEVFSAFLRLGLTSFGGPVAHLGYFRTEFVLRRRWVSEQRFAELLTLSQFLPGPASSQLGFALGLLRAGALGALAAFVAFTTPSVLLLIAFAHIEPLMSGLLGMATIHGLKLVAVCVVAHAVVGMAGQLTPDLQRKAIAVAGASAILLTGHSWTQLIVIACGAALGLVLCRHTAALSATPLRLPYGAATALALLGVFVLLLFVALALPVGASNALQLAAGLYGAGALVFGGGHVVLPLLEQAVVGPGLLSADEFLAGYGAAQAVPGPMFSFAAYLGAKVGGAGLAVLGVLAIFLPGFLALGAALPSWSWIVSRPAARSMLAGVNAAVVGLLGAALYNPVWTSAVEGAADTGVAVVGFVLLMTGRISTLWVVAWCVAASIARYVWASMGNLNG